MPISDLQAKVLKQIAANRGPDSYLAGATVLHRSAESPRYSHDLDIFHDAAERVAQSAEIDAATLQESGYPFEWLLRTPTFHRAVVTVAEQQLLIEWAQDSCFRFFPAQEDETCGYRLHDADAATNKVLAMAGRNEARDFVDVLHLHRTYLSLGALAWAACGKDPGFTPEFLLDHAARHTAYAQLDIDRLHLRMPLDVRVMKRDWLAALEEARALVAALPPDELGSLYLDADGRPLTPDLTAARIHKLVRHRGSPRGAWPTITTYAGPGTPR